LRTTAGDLADPEVLLLLLAVLARQAREVRLDERLELRHTTSPTITNVKSETSLNRSL